MSRNKEIMEQQIKQLKIENAKLKGMVKAFIDYLNSEVSEAEAKLKQRAKDLIKEVEV